jgi:putative endonuclease
MPKPFSLGKRGEQVAVDYLIAKGYRIIERNWYSSHKELDIIAQYEDWLVIVEVKTRTGETWEPPEQAVDRQKIRHLVQAAHHYVCSNQIDLPVRFDVISIIFEESEWHIEHFEDAFLATNT